MFTNTYEPEETVPKTADSTPIIPLSVVVVAAAAMAVVSGRKMAAAHSDKCSR